jgi:hypothetical protein
MGGYSMRWRPRQLAAWLLMIGVVVAANFAFATISRAQDDAAKLLKTMSDYVAIQKTISATFDSTIEVITPELQKLQFTSSGQVSLSRPGKLRATRTGGYADVELVFDGKTATIFGKNINAYAQIDAPGSIDELIDRLQGQTSMELPGADLLLSNAYAVLMSDVIDAKHIGQGVINGVDCEHLAFRDADTDWQIWIEIGPHPIPRQFIITSKAVTGGPQYTLRIKDWKTDAAVGGDTFVFSPPADAKKVDVSALSGIDEIPPGVVVGGQK